MRFNVQSTSLISEKQNSYTGFPPEARFHKFFSILVNGLAILGVTASFLTLLHAHSPKNASLGIAENALIFFGTLIALSVALAYAIKLGGGFFKGSNSADESQSYSSPLLDSLKEGILAADSIGNLTLVNQAMRDFYCPECAVGSTVNWCRQFPLYTNDGSRLLESSEYPLIRALNGEQFENLEALVLGQNSQARYCMISGHPIQDQNNKNLGALIVVHDVSDRRRFEQEVARLASIVECSLDAVIGVNLDGAIVSWNDAATRLFRVSQSDIFGAPASILVQSEDKATISEAIRNVIKGATVASTEMTLIRAEGDNISIALRYAPIQYPLGTIIGVSVTAADISNQKRAEQALLECQKQLAEAQQAARMGTWEQDVATRKLVWSLQMYRLFDFDPVEGTPGYNDILDRYHTDDKVLFFNTHELALKTGQKYNLIVRILLPSGDMRYCEIVGQPVKDEGGNIVQVIGTALDITERKLVEQEINDTNFELEFQKRALEEANGRLESLSITDNITGLMNRRALDALLEYEFARSSRYRAGLSLIIIHVDCFTDYIESFGQAAGDDVLCGITAILKQGTRDSDTIARFNDDELCIVLPETTLELTRAVAQRLCSTIAAAEWRKWPVTASAGLSTFRTSMTSAKDLLLEANEVLNASREAAEDHLSKAA
jgi:diguanylate cyclase (GGDEF)-like protein/PAS domain S-box-containing protein